MMNFEQINTALLPELALLFLAFASLFRTRFKIVYQVLAPAVCGLMAYSLLQPIYSQLIFSQLLVINIFTQHGKILLMLASLAACSQKPSMTTPILIATLAGMMMISSYNLITLYLAMELMSIALCTLSAKEEELPLTSVYILSNSLSSQLYLFGTAAIYGTVGSTDFSAISETLLAQESMTTQQHEIWTVLMVMGIASIIVSILYKMAIASRHNVTITIIPHVALCMTLAHLLYGAFISYDMTWKVMLIPLGSLAGLLGSIATLTSSSTATILAYSATCNLGLALLSMTAGNEEGTTAFILYLTLYTLNYIGLSAILASAPNNRLWRGALLVLLMSISGLPPFAGFIAKFSMLYGLLKQEMYTTAITATSLSIILACGCLRLMWKVCLKSDGQTVKFDIMPKLIASIAVLVNILQLVFPGSMMQVTNMVAKSIFDF